MEWMEPMLKIETMTVGMAQSNCYIVHNETEAIIVDPGGEQARIEQTIERLDIKPIAILLTHTHYDHIGALEGIRDTYNVPVYVAAEENSWLMDPMKNLSGYVGEPITTRPAEEELLIGDEMTIGDFTFKVLPTPGHSPGGVSFVFMDGDFVITGDALFGGSIGRTDFPGSNHEQLLTSIREQLFTLPEHYTIYPGHMGRSTIGHEKNYNPFF